MLKACKKWGDKRLPMNWFNARFLKSSIVLNILFWWYSLLCLWGRLHSTIILQMDWNHHLVNADSIIWSNLFFFPNFSVLDEQIHISFSHWCSMASGLGTQPFCQGVYDCRASCLQSWSGLRGRNVGKVAEKDSRWYVVCIFKIRSFCWWKNPLHFITPLRKIPCLQAGVETLELFYAWVNMPNSFPEPI